MSENTTDLAAKREAKRRAEYVAGLRALADAIEQHPDLELPYDGDLSSINIIPIGSDNQREQIAAWARAMPGEKKKRTSKDGKSFYLDGQFRGVKVTVICDREEVCERIVTGTREVTKTVPDPEALAAVPTVEVVETVEDVEWRCMPLLADREPAEVNA